MNTRISVKSVKIIQSMSEETLCFTAKVYFDGKHVGSAQNRGHGGPTDVYLDIDKVVRKDVEDYVATLPEEKWSYDGKDYSRKLTVDDVVDLLVEEYNNKKEDEKLDKLSQKHKKKYAEKGYPVTLEVRLPHQIMWTAVRDEKMVQQVREELAKKHNIDIEKVKIV